MQKSQEPQRKFSADEIRYKLHEFENNRFLHPLAYLFLPKSQGKKILLIISSIFLVFLILKSFLSLTLSGVFTASYAFVLGYFVRLKYYEREYLMWKNPYEILDELKRKKKQKITSA